MEKELDLWQAGLRVSDMLPRSSMLPLNDHTETVPLGQSASGSPDWIALQLPMATQGMLPVTFESLRELRDVLANRISDTAVIP